MGAQYTCEMRDLTLDTLRLDTTAWTVLRETANQRAWQLPTGGGVALEVFHRPPDLKAATVTSLRDQYRDGVLAAGGGLVSAEVGHAAGCGAITTVFKFPQATGMAYLASLTWPFAQHSVVLKVQCAESGATGVREAALLPAFMDAHPALNPAARPNAWMFDPYRPDRSDALMRTIADDEKYDAVFPDHPLSRARATIRAVAATATFDEDVLSALLPFALPAMS
jgi:hypothetical protein